jgi:5-methylcytosine-specific restriction endonuclease McrA
VLCKPCHKAKTKKERETNKDKEKPRNPGRKRNV